MTKHLVGQTVSPQQESAVNWRTRLERRIFFTRRYPLAQTSYLLWQALLHLGPRGAAEYFLSKFRCGGHSKRTAAITVASGRRISLRNCRTDLAIFEQVMLLNDCLPGEMAAGPVEYIIDAGAHIGCSSVYYALRFPRARILAVEAEPSNYAQLVINTAKLPQIRPLHAAVFHRAGEVVVSNPTSEPWGFQVGAAAEFADTPSRPLIRAMTVDELIDYAGFPRVDILKLDIEGAEKEIFQADVRSWLPRVRCMTVELHDRIKPGCSESFRRAVGAIPHRLSETVNNVLWISLSDDGSPNSK